MNSFISKIKQKSLLSGLLGIVLLIVIYVAAIGLISSPSGTQYKPEPLPANATDRQRAEVIATGVTYALDEQLHSLFGFLPNDLIAPWILDNTPQFQRGVIFATRPASEIVAQTVARFGTRDTLDQRLADATSRFFSYSENVWGFLFIYDAEGMYKSGIKNWYSWAGAVGSTAKNAGVYNLKSDDVYNIIRYCISMTDYALGVLNNDQSGHFKADDNVYYTKGIAAVTGNVLRSLIAVDHTLLSRGGQENINEALLRLDMIAEFNPVYVMAGGNKVGDAMMPNHVAALARHFDILGNRLNDILSSMAR